MLENITDRLSGALRKLSGNARITEENIAEAARDLRLALLEADVALPVAREFVERVKARALGEEVLSSLTPAQAFVGVARDELESLLGGSSAGLDLACAPPAVILLVGLQGAGKTTSAAKIAFHLRHSLGKKKILLASLDVYRPAAMRQLEIAAASAGADFLGAREGSDPREIAREALAKAKIGFYDALVLDTAGRLAVDEALMAEIRDIREIASPRETLLAVDAMAGQDALSVARAFHEAVPLTGLILTKADGDSRGGAILSAHAATGVPVKFLGVSEKPDGLEAFHPDRIASRILGMGDILSLVEQAKSAEDAKDRARLESKLERGADFDLDDFLAQLRQMRRMGGIASFLDKLPGGARAMASAAPGLLGDKPIARMEAVILSMTPKERSDPSLLKASRKQRVAKGAGVPVSEVNTLLRQYEMAANLMKSARSGNLGALFGAPIRRKSKSKGKKKR